AGAADASRARKVASSRRGSRMPRFSALRSFFILPNSGNGLFVDRKRLLVVATTPVDAGPLREAVRDRSGADAEIRIVAPATDLSPLQWLASDEDSAREEAATVATEAEGSVAPEA